MKKSNLVVLMILAALLLPGCGFDPIGWMADQVRGVFVSFFTAILEATKQKYVPTEWHWWALALLTAIWLPWRFPGIRSSIYVVGAISLIGCAANILLNAAISIWTLLIPIGIVLLILKFVFGVDVIKMLKWVWEKATKAKEKGENAVKAITELAPDEDSGAKEVRSAIIAYLLSLWIQAILFGGKLPDSWATASSMGKLDWALRGLGCLLALIMVIVSRHDLFNSHWMCSKCKEMNWWNIHRDQAVCGHCGDPNPNAPPPKKSGSAPKAPPAAAAAAPPHHAPAHH